MRIIDSGAKRLTGLVAVDDDLAAIIDGTSIGAAGAA